MNDLAGLSVLLVEDEFLIALDAEQALMDLGAASVEIVATLREADAIAGQRRFDLAMLDVNVNGEMSFPIAEKFRARGVPVMFATGYDLRDRDAVKNGCGVCVEKPYTREKLREGLRAVLSQQAAVAPSLT